jgi:hypothetical protein
MDEVTQLIPNGDTPGGFEIFNIEVHDYPSAFGDFPAGMHILSSLPDNDTEFEPDAFLSGSRQTLVDVVHAVEKKWGRTQPEVVADWIKFRDELAPQSDDASEYCREHGLYIPLKVSYVSVCL